VFRDSLIENAVELTGLLKHFNLTNDADMERARTMLEESIYGIDADDLRENDSQREEIKNKVDAILNKFNF